MAVLLRPQPRLGKSSSQITAQARGKLRLIHAIQVGNPGLLWQSNLEKETHRAEREVARCWIADLQKKVGSDAPVQIVVGSVKQALLDAARRYDADVLMVGRSPESGAHGRLRDLTYAIVRDSPFPVVSI